MTDPSELISAYLDGHLTPEQAQALRAWIRATPANAERFARETYEHSLTTDLFAAARSDTRPWSTATAFELASAAHEVGTDGSTSDGDPSLQIRARSAPTAAAPPRTASRRWWLLRWTAVAAAAVLLFAAFGSWSWLQRAGADVAIVVQTAGDVGWGGEGSVTQPRPGDALRAGSFSMKGGTARLRLTDGAVITLAGPASFELQSGSAMRLSSGRLAARVEPAAAGFTVHTPTASIVDLGTEFGVIVEPSGATETHVVQGSVNVGPRAGGGGTSQRLAAGTAGRVEPGGATVATIPARPSEFAAAAFAVAEAPASATSPAPVEHSYSLPVQWKGRSVGSSDGNPVRVDGQPRWRFDRVWPDDPSKSANYVPLVWNGTRWMASEHVQGDEPSVEIVDGGTLRLRVRGPWGTGRPGSTDAGGKWPAFSFIAPRDGRYTLEGDAAATHWDGPAPLDLVVLKVAPNSRAVSMIAEMTLVRGAPPRPIEGCVVELLTGQRLVLLARVTQYNNAGFVIVDRLRITQAR